MTTKLTLTLEKEIINQAKKYASAKGRSLSEMVSSYFKYLTETENASEPELAPKTKRLKGIIKVDADFDYQQVLEEERSHKHEK
ncbi:MAG: DUF6364 family protein [Bacteroidota bacterium]